MARRGDISPHVTPSSALCPLRVVAYLPSKQQVWQEIEEEVSEANGAANIAQLTRLFFLTGRAQEVNRFDVNHQKIVPFVLTQYSGSDAYACSTGGEG